MEQVIELENFYFAYKKSDLVLQDISLKVKKVALLLLQDLVVPVKQLYVRQ